MDQASNTTPLSPATEVSCVEKRRLVGPDLLSPSSLSRAQIPKKNISLNQLINIINHIDFQDQKITVVFRHHKNQRLLNFAAAPQACHDRRLICRWIDAVDIKQLLESYQFHRLYIPKEQRFIEVQPELGSINERQAVFTLPQVCREISERKIRRHRCHGVKVFMLQDSVLFHGELADYSASQFRIIIQPTPARNYRWINTQIPSTIIFTKGPATLYSGECRIVKHDHGLHQRSLNLEPAQREIHRFKPRKFRSTRQMLNPTLDAVFTHPLFEKTIHLKVVDISGSGFSVEEKDHQAVLLPGLIIPDLALTFSDGSFVRCVAQVIYSRPLGKKSTGTMLRCGVAILDMAIEDHIKLLALLHQASDAHAYLCNRVNMASLWEFFFETGFIYSEKYEFIRNNKEEIKNTYNKIYSSIPSIANHFVYQENDRILAHMAMIRFYESAWLIHHHAAIRSSNNRGGLMVLKQASRFINDSYRLSAMKMDYVFCYFRPDNKFPNHVFGGTARHIDNPQICSIDNLAYFHYRQGSSKKQSGQCSNWQLAPASSEDLLDLLAFYENHSGGLMLQGLHLHPGKTDCGELISAYHSNGLKRDRHIFALNHHDTLCAIVVVNSTDAGLNLSNLTNSIQFFVTHDRHLTHEVVCNVIDQVAHHLEAYDIPILFYPRQAAIKAGLKYEKTYCIWVYDTHRNIDHYFHFLKRLLKFIQP